MSEALQPKTDQDSQQHPSGERIIRALYRLVRIVKLHQDNNRLLIQGAEELAAALAPWWLEESHLTIQVLRGRFFVEDFKLFYGRESVKFVQELLEYFEKRNLRGLMFSSATALLGSHCLAIYAASNAYLDGLARNLRQH